ncbi:NUDIX hydrolase [Patescibacteria group bacterium]
MRKYYTALPFIVALIIDEEGRILVGKHPHNVDKPFPGHWDLPAGKLKENESFEECLKREVKEETGFDIDSFEIHGVHHNFGENLPEMNVIPGVSVCYRVEVSGEFKPDELEDMHFADKKDLKTMEFTPWAKYFLEEFLT